jgi:putative ABC transport system substrate-binding protein
MASGQYGIHSLFGARVMGTFAYDGDVEEGATDRALLARLALMRRLPLMVGTRAYMEPGALMSYGPDTPAMFRYAAVYIDKILKGKKPADLPVEQPTKLELVVNLKTAKELGITFPPSIMVQAEEVIE